jgi:hypothetical protein
VRSPAKISATAPVSTIRPAIEHGDAVAYRSDHLHLMRDQHDRQPEFLIEFAQQRQHAARRFGIERARRLVAQQDMSGRVASARAIPTRCFCPPESCAGYLCA